jgi:hypothetical protein
MESESGSIVYWVCFFGTVAGGIWWGVSINRRKGALTAHLAQSHSSFLRKHGLQVQADKAGSQYVSAATAMADAIVASLTQPAPLRLGKLRIVHGDAHKEYPTAFDETHLSSKFHWMLRTEKRG